MKSDHDRKHAQEYKRNCRKCSLRSWRDLRKSAVYIVFAAEEFRIVFAAEPREEWAQYGEEGRPCLPNILVKIEKFHFNLANVRPRSKRSLNIVNNVPNLFLLALFCSLNVK